MIGRMKLRDVKDIKENKSKHPEKGYHPQKKKKKDCVHWSQFVIYVRLKGFLKGENLNFIYNFVSGNKVQIQP